jgi:hypothetical protein
MLMPSNSGTGYYPEAMPESCFPCQAADMSCSSCAYPPWMPVRTEIYLLDDVSVFVQ